ncbi:ribosome biogenesis GTP-binding protein YihA/YsxC [Lutispora sp.]|uniref:ribosome biogenesis GTP-binding protein YihA/YsxC n=1 Tax=Lutispora sp. TaxID=2828727 RepID=UPI000EDAA288|nr:ribosome biogenesis GTP-binding protein YihA/YsxC [Lutispora sp.]MEA4961924.1 ribosome biogenesis GTP-binding protein YihA/YsxC [Lutispora sp.]HCJ58017.1 YihA family ribosome biogenesis GTP-binding protein [Clostridiaceae bacterium]
MIIKDCRFLISAVSSSQYPEGQLPEIAFAGRSNVGKSSLINSLLNRKKLVKVSSNPGKTRTINFFMINEELIFVDLPGYGYAAVSNAEKLKWGTMIEEYLTKRDNLKSVVLLVDIRHKPTADDKMMYDFIKHYMEKVIIVATKRDKISNNVLGKNLRTIKETLGTDEKDILISYSSENHNGREELWEEIMRSF